MFMFCIVLGVVLSSSVESIPKGNEVKLLNELHNKNSPVGVEED